MMRAVLPVAALVTLVIGVLAAAQSQPQPGPARDTPAQQRQTTATGRVSGRVVTADLGRPLRRVRVALGGGGLPGGRAALTDDSGVFSFTELPAGRYTLTAARAGYVSLSYGQRRPLQAGTPLQLAEGQELKGLEIRLPRGGVISGHVLDDVGEPMPGATVRVMMYRYAQGNRQLVPAGTAQTDDRGEYRVWGLNPGEYYVSAIGRTFNLNAVARGVLLPAAGGAGGRQGPGGGGGAPDPALIESALAARGLAGLAGDLAPADPNDLAYAPTYYPGVPSPNEARPITVGLSAEVVGIDFTILLVRTGRISGRVTNPDGSVVASGNVNLAPEVAGGRAGLGGGYGSRIQAGVFSIPNVPPGRYILRAFGDVGRGRGRGSAGPPQYASLPLSVDGDLDGVFVTLASGATLTGAITVQATQTATLPDVTQFRIAAPPVDSAGFGPNPQARVSQDGTFTLEGIAAGLHWVRAQAPRGWTLKSVVVDGREVIDTPLEVRSAEQINDVSLVFTDKLSEVNGTLTDQAGAPMMEYTVLAFPTDSSLWRPESRHIMTTRPDQNGRFQLRGLPPGTYYLAAIDPAEPGEWFEPAFLDEQRFSASRFTLGEGDVRTENLRVTLR